MLFMRQVLRFARLGLPSHFPYDAHGLYMFDGANTYEYADMRKDITRLEQLYFNYKRGEVKSFLISSGRFWCDRFMQMHPCGRSKLHAEIKLFENNRQWNQRIWRRWKPRSISFIKDLNETLFRDFRIFKQFAEEATDWPGISKPTLRGGLGFGMKWMMDGCMTRWIILRPTR